MTAVLSSISDVRRFVLSRCSPMPARSAVPAQALGLVLAEPVSSGEDVPPFTNSSMDGYALRAADVSTVPARLVVIGALMAGDDPSGTSVGPGQAVRIMTGAVLPPGADAVCMVEHTTEEDGRVWVHEPVGAGANVRPAGDDIRAGQEVFAAGTVIGPAHVGVLASLGVERVSVYARPRVGVISTGDELVSGPGPLPVGKIRDSNRPALLAQLGADGFVAVDLGHAPDDVDGLAASLAEAGEHCDAVLTSGGVSVGDRDIVKMLLEKYAADDARWFQVAVKPAKPFAFALLAPRRLPVFGLPGNPVSALVSYELFARPALRLMGGHSSVLRPRLSAVAGTNLYRVPDGKDHLLRVVLSVEADGTLCARPSGAQGSHQMLALAEANALAVLPDGAGVMAGQPVSVLLLDAGRLGGSEDAPFSP